MKIKYILTILLLILAFDGPILAQETSIDKFESNCSDKNPSTQGINECIDKAMTMWDKDLNKYYKLLMGKLNKQQRIQLQKAQIQWLKFRDEEYKNIITIYGAMEGTIYQNFIMWSKRDIVKQRTLQLKKFYEDITGENF
jgi:uncharacterized protein YecT (DUF1311 family)